MAAFKTLPTRRLGNGPLVPRLGLGLMGFRGTYGQSFLSHEEMLEFLDEAYKRGERFWDTGGFQAICKQRKTILKLSQADEYGDSEAIIGKWFAANPGKRQDIFLATKFGIVHTPTPPGFTMNSTPEYCRTAIEASLGRLGVPCVDLYYVHRLDKVTPVEKTMQVMVELKDAGKIKHIGLSECSAESLRRAYAIHPITCVQMEYSIFCTEIESPQRKLLETARELGEDISRLGDKRRILPWLQEGNIEQNVALVNEIAALSRAKGVTTPQLALAWLLAQGDDIFPIPGASKTQRLEENLKSLFISLSEEEEKKIRQLGEKVAGGRFQAMTGYDFADTPALE
ncbi:Aldo/keto reductase [Penicillium longicatenatum]|uniref:Aldo/keto reductase n=1 Tax=Penicillium longicatenatum TaxID=1561947 RepID=UPI002548A37B|nr:Aldo/keto reductase [Penicillium longicatenatum]KAJ5658507.1 Aldo/keto reductase [Penicillium longicatenatum]